MWLIRIVATVSMLVAAGALARVEATASEVVSAQSDAGATRSEPESGGENGDRSMARRAGFGAFLQLGVEHIWTGYDHLLFLLALLVVCRDLRSVLVIVSCFTVAHSVTLGLATMDWVRLPPKVIEVAIAASIVLVGVENLWRGGEALRGRAAVTLIFGLVHGFGFANVLRDFGVGRDGGGIALPLFSFNLGVELGQLAIAAVVLPIYWQLARDEQRARAARKWTSLATVGLGGYWLLERAVGA
ncbi:MAG: HupE/UreJ family protein [Opitutus sp.]|nr:HupE/UreJ family protein [Opitutus sp.]